MDESKRLLVRNWIIKSKHDLETAAKLASGYNPYLDTAIYHCQQAAEKAVKGFLILHDCSSPRTHDVGELIENAISVEPGISDYLEDGENLTPYAGRYIYPGEVMDPDREEFEEALKSARKIFDFILSKMPDIDEPLSK